MLQKICDALQPGTINVFFQRWLHRLPLPLGAADQEAGYWWELSMAQVEVSRTIVFTQPRHARAFFEALVTDNLDLGRPDTIEIVFGRRIINGTQRATQGTFKTKVITRGTEVTINAFYRHSRIKQYLKDGRALRIETVNQLTHQSAHVRANVCKVTPEVHRLASRLSWTWSPA